MRAHSFTAERLLSGKALDRIDFAAGLAELKLCGYEADETEQVILYALQRWARGEEEAAERGAIDRSFYGIDLTSWRRVLAAGCAAAYMKAEAEKDLPDHPDMGIM